MGSYLEACFFLCTLGNPPKVVGYPPLPKYLFPRQRHRDANDLGVNDQAAHRLTSCRRKMVVVSLERLHRDEGCVPGPPEREKNACSKASCLDKPCLPNHNGGPC